MPYAGWCYPTTNEHLERLIHDPQAFEGHIWTDKFLNVKKFASEIRGLAYFILKYRKQMKFRIQSNQVIIYGTKKLIHDAITAFWDEWQDVITTNNEFVTRMDRHTMICNRLPHRKYEYQVWLKRDTSLRISENKRQGLANYLANDDVGRVANQHMREWLSGKSDYCEGYFYIRDEKSLTPVYMLINEAIDRVIKFVKI